MGLLSRKPIIQPPTFTHLHGPRHDNGSRVAACRPTLPIGPDATVALTVDPAEVTCPDCNALLDKTLDEMKARWEAEPVVASPVHRRYRSSTLCRPDWTVGPGVRTTTETRAVSCPDCLRAMSSPPVDIHRQHPSGGPLCAPPARTDRDGKPPIFGPANEVTCDACIEAMYDALDPIAASSLSDRELGLPPRPSTVPTFPTHSSTGGGGAGAICGHPVHPGFTSTSDPMRVTCDDCLDLLGRRMPVAASVTGGGSWVDPDDEPEPAWPAVPDAHDLAVIERLDMLESSITDNSATIEQLRDAVRSLADRLGEAESPGAVPGAPASPPAPGASETLTEAEILAILEEFGHDPETCAEVLAGSGISSDAVDRVDGRHSFDSIPKDVLAELLWETGLRASETVNTGSKALADDKTVPALSKMDKPTRDRYQDFADRLATILVDPDRTPLR